MMADYPQSDKDYIENLKAKFRSADTRKAMNDEERLALLLSYTDCSRNLSHVMASIKEMFPSLKDIYRHSYYELMQIDKMTHHGACAILLTAKTRPKPKNNFGIFKSDSDYEKLFCSVMPTTSVEEIWAATFNAKNEFITAKRLGSGTFSNANMSIGDLISFAVSVNSHKIVIAHSHPYVFNAEMSKEDEDAIYYIGTALARFSISLYGHVIVSENCSKFYRWAGKDDSSL